MINTKRTATFAKIVLLVSCRILAVEAPFPNFEVERTRLENMALPVDLPTGDLLYGLNVFSIPIPGGNPFQLNLNYSAGIPVKPEASWVGLGFSLEAGSVFRQKNGMPDDAKSKSIYLRNSNQIVSRAETTTDRARASTLHAEYRNSLREKDPRMIDGGGSGVNTWTTSSYDISFSFFGLTRGFNYQKHKTSADWFQVFRRDYDLSYYGFLYADQTGKTELDRNYTENTLPPNKVHISEGHIGLDEGTIDHGWPKFPFPQKDDFFCTFKSIAGSFQAFKRGKSQFLPSNLSFHSQVNDAKFVYSPDYVKSNNPSTDFVFRFLDERGGFHHQSSYYDSYDNTRKGTLNEFTGRKVTPTYNSTTGLIESFSIKDMYGFTYEFGIPVYQYDEYSENADVNSGGIQNSGSKYASTSTTTSGALGNTPFYATEWLLTKILGPDYSDANSNGAVDPADRGYWIKFSYQRTTNTYDFRYPFSLREIPPVYSLRSNTANGGTPIKLSNSVQFGRRDVYYLRNIETASHIAVFEISKRQDAFEHGNPVAGTLTMGTDALFRLDEIALYNRKAFTTDYNGNTFWDRSDANENSLRRVVFNYDYSLATGVPNSTAGGKLTLKSIRIGDHGLATAFPYSFEYFQNSYGESKFDRWGYLKSDATYEEHLAVKPDDVKSWSLKKVTMPTGGSMEMEYQSDSYSHIYDKEVRGAMDTYNDHKEFYEPLATRNGETFIRDLMERPDFWSRPECINTGSQLENTPKKSCYTGWALDQHVEGQPRGYIDGKNVCPVSNFFQRTDCWNPTEVVYTYSTAASCWQSCFQNYDFRGYDELKLMNIGNPPLDDYKTQAGVIQIRHSGYGNPSANSGQRLVQTVPASSSRDFREAIINISELPPGFKIDEIDAYALMDWSGTGSNYPKGKVEIWGGTSLVSWTKLSEFTSPTFNWHRWIRLKHVLAHPNTWTKIKVKVIGVNSTGVNLEVGQKDLRVYVIDKTAPKQSYEKFGGGVRVSKLTYSDPVTTRKKEILFYYGVGGDGNSLTSGSATTEPPLFTHDDNNDRKIHSEQTTGLLLPSPRVLYNKVTLKFPNNGWQVFEFVSPKDKKNLARQYWNPNAGGGDPRLSAAVQLPSGGFWGREYYLKYIDNSSHWGAPVSTSIINENGNLVKRQVYTYVSSLELPKDNRNGFTYEESRIFQREGNAVHSYTAAHQRNLFFLKKRVDELDLVTGTTEFDYPDDKNGEPNQQAESNSDGRTRVTATKPAYTEYPGMATKNMLMQSTQQTIHDMPSGTTLPVNLSAQSSRVVSSSVTTWSDQTPIAPGSWRPASAYVWKEKMGSSGLPVASFVNFQFCGGCSNDPIKWLKKSSAARYDKFGRNVTNDQMPDNAKMKSSETTVFGYKGLYPVGTIRNANYREASVLTGGYLDNENGYADMQNGWEMGGSPSAVTYSSTFPLFGSGNIKVVNAFGPTRNNKVIPGKEYRLTAWVRAETGNMTIGGDYRKLQTQYEATEESIWPIPLGHLDAASPSIPGYSKTVPAKSPPVWEKVEIRFKTDNVPHSGSWYTRLFIGTANGGVGYLQDVRILPSEALATSMYYVEPMMLPEISLDANSNPGRRTKYDGFGRPTQIFRVNIPQSIYSGDILAESKEYQLLTP